MIEEAEYQARHPLPARGMRVAAAQAQAVAGDVPANAATVAAQVRQAAEAGAAPVVFPDALRRLPQSESLRRVSGGMLALT